MSSYWRFVSAIMTWLTITKFKFHKWQWISSLSYSFSYFIYISMWLPNCDLFPALTSEKHNGCHLWNRSCLLFQSIWAHPRFHWDGFTQFIFYRICVPMFALCLALLARVLFVFWITIFVCSWGIFECNFLDRVTGSWIQF